MNFQNESINEYCVQHSAVPSDVCAEIADYTRANVPMAVMLTGPQEASFLGFLIRSIAAKRVLEVGSFTGYSALAMAENLPPDGEVITLDINPETNAIAKRFWAKSPHGTKIKSFLGPASDTFKALKGQFDFVFIDADKVGYSQYFNLALPLLSPHGIIACDNCLYGGDVLQSNPTNEGAIAIKKFNEEIKSRKDLYATLTPIRDGVLLITKRY